MKRSLLFFALAACLLACPSCRNSASDDEKDYAPVPDVDDPDLFVSIDTAVSEQLVDSCSSSEVIRMKPACLDGDWVWEKEGVEQGFSLGNDGSAFSIGDDVQEFKSWSRDGDELTLIFSDMEMGGEEDIISKWRIEALSADTLVISNSEFGTRCYTRKK